MISIVVPARNEPNLEDWADRISSKFPGIEIVIVETSPMAAALSKPRENIRWIHAPQLATRAKALNEGARVASGRTLFFLHADCDSEPDAISSIQEAVDRGAVGGAFRKKYAPSTPLLNLQAAVLNFLASRWKRGVTGTNGIFIRKDLFDTWGGFADVSICEDLLLWNRLRSHGRTKVLPSRLIVSSRRYRSAWGLPRMARNALVLTFFRLGISDPTLARIYRG